MYYGVDGKELDNEAVAERDIEETRRFPFAGLKEAMNNDGEDKLTGSSITNKLVQGSARAA